MTPVLAPAELMLRAERAPEAEVTDPRLAAAVAQAMRRMEEETYQLTGVSDATSAVNNTAREQMADMTAAQVRLALHAHAMNVTDNTFCAGGAMWVTGRVVDASPEQIEEYQRQIVEQQERANKAAQRGMALLKSWLSKEQLEQYERNQFFDVVGSKGTRYRITNGVAGNVQQFNRRGKHVASWCFQPVGCLCMGDTMLAQKIALETDEEATIKVANKMGEGYLTMEMLVEMPPLRRGSRLRGWLIWA